jgi:U3 small nucleolar ribonucleoprotein component
MTEHSTYIQISDEGITYDCKDKNVDDTVESIIEEYERHDVELCTVLDRIEVHGLNVNQVVQVYAKLFERIEHDKVLRHYEEGGYENLATGKHTLNKKIPIEFLENNE